MERMWALTIAGCSIRKHYSVELESYIIKYGSTIYRDHKGFLPKNLTYIPAKHLLCDSLAALVRYSQAQKCLQNNAK